jgi:hypothetical protein
MNAHMADMGEQRNIVDRGEVKPCLAACEDQVSPFPSKSFYARIPGKI